MVDSRHAELERARVEYTARDEDEGYAARWSILRPDVLSIVESRERAVLGVLASMGAPIETMRILDLGCGVGAQLSRLISYGANPESLSGIDLSDSRIASARKRLPSGVRLVAGSADAMPFESGSFDVVLQYTVMSSVLDAELRAAIAREMLRVLRPGGILVWYDMRRDGFAPARKWNQVRSASSTWWFDEAEVRGLFPDCAVSTRSVILAPWIGGRFATRPALYRVLESVPALRSHCLAVVAKP